LSLREFRRSYLQPVEGLIVFGGNTGTQEEVQAALDLDTVLVIACENLGGTGKKMASEADVHGIVVKRGWQSELKKTLDANLAAGR